MRLLAQSNIAFLSAEYEYAESDLSGIHAADSIGMPREQVFKTLVTRSGKGGIYVFCLPVCDELDLKKAARVCGEKNLEMLRVKELPAVTGYIRGGCSPIGMKKKFPTFIDETAILFEEIAISAGMRGQQVILRPADLQTFTGAMLADITV